MGRELDWMPLLSEWWPERTMANVLLNMLALAVGTGPALDKKQTIARYSGEICDAVEEALKAQGVYMVSFHSLEVATWEALGAKPYAPGWLVWIAKTDVK